MPTNKHPNLKDQRAAISWARKVLKNKQRYVILDTETTGIDEDDEIIEISVIDIDSNCLLSSRICPTKKKSIPKAATDVHGISYGMLNECPKFADLAKEMKRAIGRRNIIAYNAEFDMRLFAQTYKLSKGFFGNKAFFPKGNWYCAMLEYAKYVGGWNDYHKNYKWQKLENHSGTADHSSLGDCLATLEIIKKMANGRKKKAWHEFWKFWISNEN